VASGPCRAQSSARFLSALSRSWRCSVVPATYRSAIGFVAILLMLTFRPRGLLGERAAVMMSYVAFIATIGGIYALLALSLNLVWGSTGLVNLGLAGFFAVGAYASAITTGAGAPVPVGLLAAVAGSIAAGLLVTFARCVYETTTWRSSLSDSLKSCVSLPSTSGGSPTARTGSRVSALRSSKHSVRRASICSILGSSPFLSCSSGSCCAGSICRRTVGRSKPSGRTGTRGLRRQSVLRFKFEAFALSAAIAGLAGALYGHQQSYISPDHFQPLITIYIFLAVTAGGVGRPVVRSPVPM